MMAIYLSVRIKKCWGAKVFLKLSKSSSQFLKGLGRMIYRKEIIIELNNLSSARF